MINFDRVIDGVFVGTCPANLLDQQRLSQAGISAVLNLQSDQDFSFLGIDWRRMERDYLELGIAVYHLPIVDFDDTDLLDKLPSAARTLNDMLEKGHKVYVHCSAGRQRSPSTVIGYLAWHTGLTLRNAIDQVMAQRNCEPPIAVLEQADTLIRGGPKAS